MKTLTLTLLLAIVIVAVLQACSLERPESADKSVTIIIDDPNHNAAMAAPALLPAYYVGEAGLLVANPTSTADFDCFGVNVTGPGISPSGSGFGNCTGGNNLSGKGQGAISGLAKRGNPIVLTVPVGTSRSVDVYGIYPTPSQCGGTGDTGGNTAQGFALGSTVIDLMDSAAVTIPISYTSGATSSFSCTTPVLTGLPLTLSAGDLMPPSGACTYSYASPPTSPTPTGSNGSPMSGGYLTEAVTDNNTAVISECSGSGGTTQFIDFSFNAANVSLASYPNASVVWKGRSGHYSGGCLGVQSTPFSGGGGTLWIYSANTSSWTQLGATTGFAVSMTTLSGTVSNPSTLPVSGSGGASTIFVRMMAPNAGSGGSCTAIYTDHVELRLQ